MPWDYRKVLLDHEIPAITGHYSAPRLKLFVVMRVSTSIVFVEPGWDVSLAVQYTPDIDMILALDIKHQARISL